MFPTRQGRESQDISFEQNQKSKSFVHALKSQLSGDMIGVINSVSGYNASICLMIYLSGPVP